MKGQLSLRLEVFGKLESCCAVAFASCALVVFSAMTAVADPVTELGKALFFDKNLSINEVQSCASCRDPAAGFTDDGVAFIPGVLDGQGDLIAPSAAYAFMSPALHPVMEDGAPLFGGGLFREGRATGDTTLIIFLFQIFLWLTRESHLWQGLALYGLGLVNFLSWYLAPIFLLGLLIERASFSKRKY